MNNPTTEELMRMLYKAAGSLQSIGEYERADAVYTADDLIEQLQQELIDERYRHDRLQDFCLAQGEELSRLKARQRWIPVTERLPEDEGEKFIKYGFEHNGEISERRFMGVASYYLHDENPHWNGEGFHGMKVTHWMEPPKE